MSLRLLMPSRSWLFAVGPVSSSVIGVCPPAPTDPVPVRARRDMWAACCSTRAGPASPVFGVWVRWIVGAGDALPHPD
jgi:hypothetical protein